MALPQIQIGDGMLGDALLSSVDVVQELNRHWWCTVVCRNTEDARVPVEDLLGKPVEVKTTDDDGVERVHFSGSVHDVQLDYEVWGSYTATLIAVSDSFGMDVTAHKQYYTDGTLSSLASTIGGRHGLGVAVNAADDKALNYVQYAESDWSFLGRVVDDHGAWMRPSAAFYGPDINLNIVLAYEARMLAVGYKSIASEYTTLDCELKEIGTAINIVASQVVATVKAKLAPLHAKAVGANLNAASRQTETVLWAELKACGAQRKRHV